MPTSDNQNQGSGQAPQPPKRFEPVRAAFFIGFVIIILIAGLWSGTHGLDSFSTACIHAFEILSGISAGIFIGEARG